MPAASHSIQRRTFTIRTSDWNWKFPAQYVLQDELDRRYLKLVVDAYDPHEAAQEQQRALDTWKEWRFRAPFALVDRDYVAILAGK